MLPPKPPQLIVFNEPETSLHPDLLPYLGDMIGYASQSSQIVVTTHSHVIADRVRAATGCNAIELEKVSGKTVRKGRTGKVYAERLGED